MQTTNDKTITRKRVIGGRGMKSSKYKVEQAHKGLKSKADAYRGKQKEPKTYKGKSTKPGGGGKFAEVRDAIMKDGQSAEAASAITAALGRKKYGKAKFAKMAAQGKKRAAKGK